MNSYQRFKNSFEFAKTDRLPIYTFGAWEEAYDRWNKEGLPADWKESMGATLLYAEV